MTKILFIHTGKCAGRTIRNILLENKIEFIHVHVHNKQHQIKKYIDCADEIIINMRDPIKRCISVYNHYKTCSKPEDDNVVVNKTRGCKTLDEFIHKNINYELLDDSITHFGLNFNFFLTYLLENENWSKVKIVIRQEHLKEDIEKLAQRYSLKGWEISEEEKREIEFSRRKSDPIYHNLSSFSIRKLHQLLEKDYAIIDFLAEKGLISMDYVESFL